MQVLKLAIVVRGLVDEKPPDVAPEGHDCEIPGIVRRPYSSTAVKIISGTSFILVAPKVTVYPYFIIL